MSPSRCASQARQGVGVEIVAGLAGIVMRASAPAAALFIDALILSRLFRPGASADSVAAKATALLALFLIAFSVKVIG